MCWNGQLPFTLAFERYWCVSSENQVSSQGGSTTGQVRGQEGMRASPKCIAQEKCCLQKLYICAGPVMSVVVNLSTYWASIQVRGKGEEGGSPGRGRRR